VVPWRALRVDSDVSFDGKFMGLPGARAKNET